MRGGRLQQGASPLQHKASGSLGWQDPKCTLSSCRPTHPKERASSPNTTHRQENSQLSSFTQLRFIPKLFKKLNYPSFGWGNSEAKSWATWQLPAEPPHHCVCSVHTYSQGCAVSDISVKFNCHSNSIEQVQNTVFSLLDVKEKLSAPGDCQL